MSKFAPLIFEAAGRHQLNPQLVAAIIQQESGGNQYAFRYEPFFFKKYLVGKQRVNLQGFVPPTGSGCSLATELNGRATSWGLMQVMGETARENGFEKLFMSELLDPKLNIDIGVKVFAGFLKRSEGTRDALLKYNGGGDNAYPTNVLMHIERGDSGYLLL